VTEPINFKITPGLRNHLQATLDKLAEIGSELSEHDTLSEYRAFFQNKDGGSTISLAPDRLLSILALAEIVTDLRLLLSNRLEAPRLSTFNPIPILERLEQAGKNIRFNAIGSSPTGSDAEENAKNVSLAHLYKQYGKELRELKNKLASQIR
jgi:hypothetical protein